MTEEWRHRVADSGEVVHELLVNRQGLIIVAEAIKVLTIEREKFQRLKDVIIEAMNTMTVPSGSLPETFMQQLPIDGNVRMYLRLNKQQNATLDALRNDLCARLGDHCGVRETVVFCAMAVADPELFSCQS
jgi:hypothetical protein